MTPAEPSTRPRVEGSREQEILDAALDELAESGYDRLTLDAVAARCRASKATLYRRWASKAALVVDAVARFKSHQPQDPDTGTLAGDLDALTCGAPVLIPPHIVDVLAGLMTAMHRDAELAAAVHERFLGPRIAMTRAVVERARDRGEIPAAVDAELLTSVVPALMFYRSTMTGPPEDPDALVRRIVHHVVLPAAVHGPVVDTRSPA